MKFLRHRFFPLLLLAFYILQSCNTAGSGEAVSLKFNLEKGKSYEYEIISSMQNEVQGQVMNSNMQFHYLIEVLDDNNGIKTLRNTYNRVKMQMDMPNTNVDIDTDTQQDTTANANDSTGIDNMMSDMFYAMKGKSFTMKVNASGEVVEISGLEEMQQAMIDGLKANTEKRPYFEAGFKSQFNEENLRQLFSQAFNIFPNKPVRVGDSWNKVMSINNGMTKINTTYTVKAIEPGSITLDASSTFDMMGSTGIQQGSFEINPQTGLITHAEYTQTFEGPMKMVTTTVIKGRERVGGH